MDLFTNFEGLSGEGLAVGILQTLVLRSPAFKSAFLEAVDGVSPVGPLSSATHFSCYREHPSEDEESGAGRIDLMLELDDAVVGIEAKLGASLQKDQPGKYLAEVERVAELLSHARRRQIRAFLVVLAPKRRRGELESLLSTNASFLSWEEILERVEDAEEYAEPFLASLGREFRSYLNRHLQFLPDFERLRPHLTSRWEEGGTGVQRDFLRRIWDLLPNGSRLSYGPSWVGYYFRAGEPGVRRGWIGFIPHSRVGRHTERGGAVFLISSSTPPATLPRGIMRPDSETKLSIDGRKVDSWEINLDESWAEEARWRERLGVFFEAAAAEERTRPSGEPADP